jgi:hypothetical protein
MTTSPPPLVSARRVSSRRTSAYTQRVYAGYLAEYPIVGECMVVLYVLPGGSPKLLQTGPITRVLIDETSRHIYVQTHNSLYRVELLPESAKSSVINI